MFSPRSLSFGIGKKQEYSNSRVTSKPQLTPLDVPLFGQESMTPLKEPASNILSPRGNDDTDPKSALAFSELQRHQRNKLAPVTSTARSIRTKTIEPGLVASPVAALNH